MVLLGFGLLRYCQYKILTTLTGRRTAATQAIWFTLLSVDAVGDHAVDGFVGITEQFAKIVGNHVASFAMVGTGFHKGFFAGFQVIVGVEVELIFIKKDVVFVFVEGSAEQVGEEGVVLFAALGATVLANVLGMLPVFVAQGWIGDGNAEGEVFLHRRKAFR